MKSKKKDTDELICRAVTDSQTLKTNLGLPKETGKGVWGGGGGMDSGFGTGMCTLWYLQ